MNCKTALLSVASVLVGCTSGVPGPTVKTCNGGLLPNIQLTVAKPCAQVYFDEQLAVMVAKTTAGVDVTETMPTVGTVTQMSANWWWFDGYPIQGYTEWDAQANISIKTNVRLDSLLHELLHAYEFRHGIENTADHPGWDVKHYYDADNAYTKLASDSDSAEWPKE